MDVRGFQGSLQSLNGIYDGDPKDTNHGRPVYRKSTKEQTCCIYWWDNRDGEAMKGWWIAPVVGGEHVWTQCTVDQGEPPRTGWKVPWHGSVDRGVVMNPTRGAKRQSPPVPDRNIKPRHVPAYTSGLGRRMADVTADDSRGQNNVNLVESEIRKVQGLPVSDFETQDRGIKYAKQQVAVCKRTQLSEKQKERLNGLERELTVSESKMKREMKDRETKMLQELKDADMKARKLEVEKHVDIAVDAVGILNSDVADHLSPEDVFESTDQTESALAIVSKDVDMLRKMLVEKDEEAKRLAKLGGSLGHPFKELTEFRLFVSKQDKKYNEIKTLSDKYKKKAHTDLALIKKEEEETRRKDELEKHTSESQIWLDETQNFLDELHVTFLKLSNSDPENIKTVTEARIQHTLLRENAPVVDVSYPAKIKVLDDRLKHVIPAGPLYEAQKKMKEMKLEIEKHDLKKLKEHETKLLNYIREQVMLEMSLLLREKNPDVVGQFHEIAGEEKKVTLDAFSEYCKNAGASEEVLENLPLIFDSIAAAGHVLEDEFPFLTQVHYKLTRPTWLTKSLVIQRPGSIRLAKDIVEVLGKPEREEPTEQMPDPPFRIKVRAKENEGWITTISNNGTRFTKMHTFEYEVVKETVMTDQFEMKGFKVLKRLKATDTFRALGLGLVESTSKAIRIKGRILNNPDLRGWATLVGNQGSAYLKPLD